MPHVDRGGTVPHGGSGKAIVLVEALEVLSKGTKHVVPVCALDNFLDFP